jgi:SNF2 family DNA or RNA helicase
MRTVHVQRLVIADTVEDRVLALQERKVRSYVSLCGHAPNNPIQKQNLADGSLGEGNGKKIGRELFQILDCFSILIDNARAERP